MRPGIESQRMATRRKKIDASAEKNGASLR
jgi:hypothetical protein